MQALLLAGGLGTRLRPLTDTIPKCLVEIHGRPLLDYWLEAVFTAGVDQAIVNTHWLPKQVEQYLDASSYADRVVLAHEPELLGTGGTLCAHLDALCPLGAERDFLVAHADNLTDVDLAAFAAAHLGRPAGCDITLCAFRTDAPQNCGILEVDARGVVAAFHEKVADPPGDLANGAIYMMSPAVAAALRQRPVADLSTEVLATAVGRIYAWEIPGYLRDIGTPESLQAARREFRTPM